MEPEIRIRGGQAVVRSGRKTIAQASVARLIQGITTRSSPLPSCGYVPEGVRVWTERGDSVGLVLEIPPDARSVRWLADGSRAAFGPKARYRTAYLSFPYCVLLLVLRQGALTGVQQLYYRTKPLAENDDRLLLTNLPNVSRGYDLQSWVCLMNVRDLSRLSWPKKLAAVRQHVFGAAFNRSSEVHEGNSYWTSSKAVEARVRTLQAWEQATRADPYFTLGVRWRPAGTTALAELDSMLGRVVADQPLETATDLAGVIAASADESPA